MTAQKRKKSTFLVRITAALRMLAYVSAGHSLVEYIQMGEDYISLSMKAFCELVVNEFRSEYLRDPTEAELRRIEEINMARGFPGCIRSIHCQHGKWKKCLVVCDG